MLVIPSYPSLCRPMRKTVLLPPTYLSLYQRVLQKYMRPPLSHDHKETENHHQGLCTIQQENHLAAVMCLPISHHQQWYHLNLPGSGYLHLIHPSQWCYLSYHQCCFTTTNPHPYPQPSSEQLLQHRCHICLQQHQCLYFSKSSWVTECTVERNTVNCQLHKCCLLVLWFWTFC